MFTRICQIVDFTTSFNANLISCFLQAMCTSLWKKNVKNEIMPKRSPIFVKHIKLYEPHVPKIIINIFIENNGPLQLFSFILAWLNNNLLV